MSAVEHRVAIPSEALKLSPQRKPNHMKPIITLLASLVVLAVIAANPWRMINETPDPDAGPLWFSGDFTPHSSFTEEGDTEDAVTLKTNQASQNQSCVRPAFREDLIPGLPSEITSRYPSRAATLTGPQRTSAATEVILTKDNRKADVRGSNGFVRCKITSTPFTNVVSGDNHTGCSICDGIAKNNWLIYHPWHDGGLPYVPATERWTITTIGVRHTASIAGFPGFLSKDEIISSSTNREVLESKWVKTDQSIGGGGWERSLKDSVPETTNAFWSRLIAEQWGKLNPNTNPQVKTP